MKRIIGSLAALALGAPLLASAAQGWVVADISLQAGPDTAYPSIVELRAGTPVYINGCIDGWTWCDVSVGDDAGWVPGTFLEEDYRGQRVVVIDYGPRIGIPVVAFSLGVYWDRHYHNRPFYAQRQEWTSRSITPHAPPRPSGAVARQSTESGTSTATTTTAQSQQRTPPMTTATTPTPSARTTDTRTRTQSAQPTVSGETERRTSSATTERREPKTAQAPMAQPEPKTAAKATDANQLKQPAEPPRTKPTQRTAMQQQEQPKAQQRSNEPKPKDQLKAPPKKHDESDKKKDEGGGGDNGG
jgi:uncharacterized protein YraI